MISIKEACRYQNFLTGVINQLTYVLNDKKNLTVSVENHFRSKGNSNAEDEILQEEVDRIFNCKANDISHLITKLIDEKVQLSMAIAEAKANNKVKWTEGGKELDFDSAVSYNKSLRDVSSTFTSISNLKDRVIKTQECDYLINVEGNQTKYFYPVEKKIEIDFDKKVVSNLNKKTLDKTDRISIAIEEFLLLNIVDFEPSLSIHDTTEDIISQFEESLK